MPLLKISQYLLTAWFTNLNCTALTFPKICLLTLNESQSKSKEFINPSQLRKQFNSQYILQGRYCDKYQRPKINKT